MKDINKIEEAAEKYAENISIDFTTEIRREAFIEGSLSEEAKEYHQEGMYTGEEVFNLLNKLRMFIWERDAFTYKAIEEWFNENKKR